MKNILDSLTKGGLGGLGDLANSFGGGGLGGLGEKLSGALTGQNGQNGQTAQNSQFGQNNSGQSAESAQNNSGFGLGGLLGAGALGGLLGTLMSGKTAKKVASGVLIAGGTAAVGAVAWNFYQKWSQNQQAAKAGASGGGANGNYNATPAQLPTGQAASSGHSFGNAPETQANMAIGIGETDSTALLLLEAMVYAAKADGHMDETERKNIHGALSAMFPDRNLIQLIDGLMNNPINPQSLAQRVQNQDEAFDLYRLSCMIVDVDHFMERSYLDALAGALQISGEQKNSLEAEVAKAKASQQ